MNEGMNERMKYHQRNSLKQFWRKYGENGGENTHIDRGASRLNMHV